MKKFLTDRNLHLLLIILSFFVWIFCFKGFVFNQLSLESDAIAYYEHFQYFTDNISRGVYPFWEAGRIKGIPAEFFMRRIGSFNPLFGYIVIQSFFEIPFRFTYLSFLALYYFLGVVGFYLLALRIFQNKTVALVTYLLFMFSSIGTRMFDSYFLLVVIPMIWFFYFLVSFACHQKRHLFIGIIFTLMILATTYVPFFFINILLTFILCYSIFYLKESGRFLQNSFRFVIKNKIFTGLCTICLGVSLMPGILLWQDAGGGLVDKKGPEFALTQRNASGEAENAISVGLETITSWGIEEDILYAVSFEDMRTFKFAILYIPVFAYIILFLGLACRIRKRLLFFFVWGFGTLLIFAHRAPFYHFLYKEIFYFKYFRNLHFFLWMIILPVFILFIGEQLKLIMEFRASSSKKKMWVVAATVFVHILFIGLLFWKTEPIGSSIAVIIGSCIVFILFFLEKFSKEGIWLPIVFFGLIVIQPLEVYGYLGKNFTVPAPKGYRYEKGAKNYEKIVLPDEDRVQELKEEYKNVRAELLIGKSPNKPPGTYMVTHEYKRFLDELDFLAYESYNARSKIMIYDDIVWVKNKKYNFDQINAAFVKNENRAFINLEPGDPAENVSLRSFSQYADMVSSDSKIVQVVDSDTNHLVLKTDFDRTRFLVYNDSYHGDWQVSIDGEPKTLWLANIAFKGVFVPAGKHIVRFQYGEPWRYWTYYLLFAVFWAVFLALIILSVKDRRNLRKKVNV